MPEEGVPLSPDNKIITREHIQRILSIFTSVGVNKIRLTGGEPLLRKDIYEIISDIRSYK
jgi:molybdenum cofactor biosynthesis enzyme MoaA